MATQAAEELISALTRRRASGEIVPADSALAALSAKLEEWGVRRVVLADDPFLDQLGAADALGGAGVEVLVWPPQLGAQELLGLEGPTATCGVSVPVAAVGPRGTLMLAASAGQGRALDAAAAYHVSIVPSDRLFDSLSDALAHVYREGHPPSALSLVSAPSRTSDIEKISTLGAHGALGLHAVVVDT
jgi:L-lactate dehydrogenase complex protein LldG